MIWPYPKYHQIERLVSESIYEDSKSDHNEDESEEEVPKVSESLRATKILLRFIEFHIDYSATLQDSITNIENVIFIVSSNERKQCKKADYFSK